MPAICWTWRISTRYYEASTRNTNPVNILNIPSNIDILLQHHCNQIGQSDIQTFTYQKVIGHFIVQRLVESPDLINYQLNNNPIDDESAYNTRMYIMRMIRTTVLWTWNSDWRSPIKNWLTQKSKFFERISIEPSLPCLRCPQLLVVIKLGLKLNCGWLLNH